MTLRTATLSYLHVEGLLAELAVPITMLPQAHSLLARLLEPRKQLQTPIVEFDFDTVRNPQPRLEP